MTRDEQIAILIAKDFTPEEVFPFPYGFLWHNGIELRPPLLASFWRNVLFFGLGYPILAIAVILLLAIGSPPEGMAILGTVFLMPAVFGGFVLGLVRAASIAQRRQELGLTGNRAAPGARKD